MVYCVNGSNLCHRQKRDTFTLRTHKRETEEYMVGKGIKTRCYQNNDSFQLNRLSIHIETYRRTGTHIIGQMRKLDCVSLFRKTIQLDHHIPEPGIWAGLSSDCIEIGKSHARAIRICRSLSATVNLSFLPCGRVAVAMRVACPLACACMCGG